MVYFTVPVVCVLACLVQTGLSQSSGCNQYSSGSRLINGCGSYGGTGTGQVSVSGGIGASGQTVVVGSVPAPGSVGFGGYSPACGSVSICGQCSCDGQSAVTTGLRGQYNCAETARNQQRSSESLSQSAPRISSATSNSRSLNKLSTGASTPNYGASYGGTGTGQVGVSGDIAASGQTVVVGSVPVLGSVSFGGCSPSTGSVYISAQCEC